MSSSDFDLFKTQCDCMQEVLKNIERGIKTSNEEEDEHAGQHANQITIESIRQCIMSQNEYKSAEAATHGEWFWLSFATARKKTISHRNKTSLH